MAVCRYCHSLISDSAGQCFTCGWDWHDPTHPVQRGHVSWERMGITAGQQFVVELCESFGGDRFTQFRAADEEPSDLYYMTETEAVDGARLMELGLNDRLHDLRLRNGDTFSFDENGQWRTIASYKRLSDQETPEWRGDTSTLLPYQAACDAAADHGRSIGLAAFTVTNAVLVDEKGSPVWHVMLEFDDNSNDEWLGFDSLKSVRVDAITGDASSIMSL